MDKLINNKKLLLVIAAIIVIFLALLIFLPSPNSKPTPEDNPFSAYANEQNDYVTDEPIDESLLEPQSQD